MCLACLDVELFTWYGLHTPFRVSTLNEVPSIAVGVVTSLYADTVCYLHSEVYCGLYAALWFNQLVLGFLGSSPASRTTPSSVADRHMRTAFLQFSLLVSAALTYRRIYDGIWTADIYDVKWFKGGVSKGRESTFVELAMAA